jgi:hypothetical protein
MSNLSDLLPAGGSGKTVELVASGALANGDTVILQSDGTVTKVLGIGPFSENMSAGSATFDSGSVAEVCVAFDPNNTGKFVVAFQDGNNSSSGTAIVGAVSGTTLSFGSTYTFNTGTTSVKTIAFDPNNSGKFVVGFQDQGNSSYGTTIVGTVSGTTISFGSKYVFNSSTTGYVPLAFDPNNSGKFVISFGDSGNSGKGTAIVGTVSGTTISFGSKYVYNGNNADYSSAIAFDPNNSGKFVVLHKQANWSTEGRANVGTMSGTTLSFGSEATFTSDTIYGDPFVQFDPNTAGKFIAISRANPNGVAVVGTVSGTTISFGSQYTVDTITNTYVMSGGFDPDNANEFVVAYAAGSANGNAKVGTISGTTISWGTPSTFYTGTTWGISVSFDPNSLGKFIMAIKGNAGDGITVLGQLTTTVGTSNLTSTNFIGTSEGAFADTATATVMLRGGITTTQSGLTTGSKYYVQGDGTLSTTPDSPSVTAGKALSVTTLLIGGSS